MPWGIVIGGEELHNNHHAYGTSAKLSSQWYEFDIGWMYIRMLSSLRLATVRKVAPQLKFDRNKVVADLATLQAVITHRYAVVTSYARSLKDACAAELANRKARSADEAAANAVRCAERAPHQALAARRPGQAVRTGSRKARRMRWRTARRCRPSTRCARTWAALWERSTESSEQLLARLQDWCHRAEASGIAPLAQFSLQLKRYA